jgi:transposase InsO family protein
MSRRRDTAEFDPATWPEFDASALTASQRTTFQARRTAIELYSQGTSIGEIESLIGINRRQLYRLIDRCVEPHEDGRPFGFRALVRYSRVASYQRVTRVHVQATGGCRGTAGAFGAMLEAHPALLDWIDKRIQAKRVSLTQVPSFDSGLRTRLGGLKRLHSEFLGECRKVGITAADYPFNTERLGIRSLAAVVRARVLQSFARSARLAGATHLKGMPHDPNASAPTARNALDVVEFDGHRLDVRLKVTVVDPLGFEQEFEIERVWLLVIIDVFSRAVLGYHVSLDHEYNRYDVIRTIEAALEPHRARSFKLPGVGYGPLGGFPSGKLPELGYATWQWFKLDNAKANLADDVRHALAEFIGCFIDAGPARTPDDRPYIERFFGSIATSLSSRLPGYTGSNPQDLRRALADPKGNMRLLVSLNEIEDLLEAAIAGYNASPHDGLNGRTPLEAMQHSIRGRGAMLNWLIESKRRTLCLMQTPRRATVRGYLSQGQRPHINFHGVRYTNALLASTAAFLGDDLRIYYNSNDLRTVRAFAADGNEIGVLKAQGAWGEVAHDLKLRQEIVRLRGRKRLTSALTRDFIGEFIENKLAKAKRSRRGASELTQTMRTLAAAPTSTSTESVHRTGPAPDIETNAPSPVCPPPRRLRIGSGFVGSI